MHVAGNELERIVKGVLRAAGLRESTAGTVAHLTVRADLQGVTTHGVSRLSYFLARIDAGVMELDPDPMVSTDMLSTALLDARNGWGQVAMTQAMEMAVDKASRTGIGAVSVAHSNHFGVAGHYVELAACAGLIGVAMTNASPAMAPYNATETFLGTNPIAFGIPTQDAPIVLDMSSSLVAKGKILRAQLEGATTIPVGWAYDKNGVPTTDPMAAMTGLLAPIGGAKGAGLALAIDLLSGVLSGTALTGRVSSVVDLSRPSETGHLAIAINPEAFVGREQFTRDVSQVASRISAMPAADGTTVLLPGELERKRTQAAAEAGIQLADDVATDLAQLADRFRVAPLLVS
ncbi:Ldh family oxidoreductase [Paenarthrobacter nicotinovorans]|uniref:Ldh family oxidoreductase n=1 Tax=Paenarthrobacter nicotinovorans TaxID=29320 RepID=UPI0038249F7B